MNDRAYMDTPVPLPTCVRILVRVGNNGGCCDEPTASFGVRGTRFVTVSKSGDWNALIVALRPVLNELAAENTDTLICFCDAPVTVRDMELLREDRLADPAAVLALEIREPFDETVGWIRRWQLKVIRKSSPPRPALMILPVGALKRFAETTGEGEALFTRALLRCCRDGLPIRLRARSIAATQAVPSAKLSAVALIWYELNRLVRYSTASLFSVVTDYIVYALAIALTTNPLIALVCGRVASLLFNFALLKNFVYPERDDHSRPFLRYLSLTAFSTSLTYFGIELLRGELRLPILLAKGTVELTMFFFNFMMTKNWVFRRGGNE